MFTVQLTSYGQTLVSSLVNIDGIILLYDTIADISSVTSTSSYTVQLDEEACGNLNKNVGNVKVQDSRSNEYIAKTILFYVLNGSEKKIVAGYSQDAALVQKGSSPLTVFLSFDFSVFTNGFLFSSIQAGYGNAAHNTDGIVHIENPDISTDDTFSVYNKPQIDALLQNKQDSLTAGEGIAIADDTVKTTGIPFGICDNTSTATAFTVTVPGIYKLEDGVCCLVKNGVITSASGFTLNVNGLGGKPVYSNMAAATRETTLFNAAYTMLFVYDSTRVDGGCWVCYRGYYSDANSIAYQIRGNTHTLPTTAKFYRYRLLFTSADGTHFVPSNTSTSTNATALRDVNQTPIDPFGEIVYYSTTTAVDANANPGPTYLWTQYAVTLGYSFNRIGAALVLDSFKPLYIKCEPQSDGSAIIDATTPYVQALPSTADGKIYIFLGVTSSTTVVEVLNNHPIYYHDGTAIRLWHGKDSYSKSEIDTIIGDYVPTSRTVNSKPLTSDIILTLDDVADGTNRAIPTNVSQLNNDAGYLTSFIETDPTVPSWAKQPSKPTYTAAEVGALPDSTVIPDSTSDLTNDSGFITSSDIPTNVSAFTNDVGYLTSHQDIKTVNNNSLIGTGNVQLDLGDHNVIESISVNNTPQTVTNKNVNITVPTATSDLTNDSGFITSASIPTNISSFINDSGYLVATDLADIATSGDYDDLINAPTNVSAFTNDAGYLTEHQSLSGYIPKVLGRTNDNAIVRFDGTSSLVQNSGVLVDDDNNVILPASRNISSTDRPKYELESSWIGDEKDNLVIGKIDNLRYTPYLYTNDKMVYPVTDTGLSLGSSVSRFSTIYTSGPIKKSSSYSLTIPDKSGTIAVVSDIPTNTNQLTNGAGFITSADLPTTVSSFTNDAGYITSSDIPSNVSAFTNDAGYLTSYTETDPTVPSWAKAQNKPSYTLDEVADGTTRKLSNYELKTNLKEGAYVDVDETTTTSSSDNLVTGKAVADYISNQGFLTSHQSLAGQVASAQYNSTTQNIEFYNAAGTKLNTDIDASDFIKDGMVSNVEISNGNLVVTFNTDAGHAPISIPLTNIFNPANYYTKNDIDTGDYENIIDGVQINGSDLTPDSTTKKVNIQIKTVNNNSLVGTGNVSLDLGDHNVIESISVNSTPQTISNKNVDITVPTNTNQLTNGAGFITSSDIPTNVSAFTNDAGYLTSYTETDPTVPSWAKQSTKPSYTLDEVADGTTRKLSNYVPTSRTVNNKALSSDITLTLDDIADGTSRSIPTSTSDLTNDSGFITSSDLPTNHVTTDTAQEITGAKTIAEDKLKIGSTSSSEDIDNYVFKRGQEFIVGTQTSSTSLWKGRTVQDALYEGMCVNYFVPVASTSTNASLELTFPDNTTSGTIPVIRNAGGTTTSTHIGVGAIVQLTLLLNRTIGSTSYERVWKMNEWYDSNTNTIGYQIRTNSTLLPASDTARYYKIYFTSADGTKWVPASVNSTNNATTARAVNQRPIDPFGRIVYMSASTNFTAGTNLTAAAIWDQYNLTLGYSFNVAGGTLALTVSSPVFIKCAPQSDGSAIIDSTTPTVQSLPSTNDGKIYIFLGIATSATQVEMVVNHPIYYHDGTGIRIWSGAVIPTKTSQLTNDAGYLTSFIETDPTVPSWAKQPSKPTYTAAEVGALPDSTVIPDSTSDLTNDSGFITSSDIPTNVSAFTNDVGYLTSYTETDPTVPSWAKASSKPSYTLDEVSDGTTRKLSDYVPTSRTINSKALTSNITLTLDDVADGTNRSIPTNTNQLTNGAGFITSSDLPTNHVTTDTSQTITGQKTVKGIYFDSSVASYTFLANSIYSSQSNTLNYKTASNGQHSFYFGDNSFISMNRISGYNAAEFDIVGKITISATVSGDPSYSINVGASNSVVFGGATIGSIRVNNDNETNLGMPDIAYKNVYAYKFIKKGGTSSQFLKADGSVDSNSYATTSQIPSVPTTVSSFTNDAGYITSSSLADYVRLATTDRENQTIDSSITIHPKHNTYNNYREYVFDGTDLSARTSMELVSWELDANDAKHSIQLSIRPEPYAGTYSVDHYEPAEYIRLSTIEGDQTSRSLLWITKEFDANSSRFNVYGDSVASYSSISGASLNDGRLTTVDYVNAKSKLSNWYAVCSTGASTKAKKITIPGFTLETGAKVIVKFTATNSASAPTLTVNDGTADSEAKPICYRGTSAVTTGNYYKWQANDILDLVYDGTNWIIVGWQTYAYYSTVASYATYVGNGSSGYVAYSNNGAAGSRALLPRTDVTSSDWVDLGASDKRWNTLYLANEINDGTNAFALPSTSGTLALESETYVVTSVPIDSSLILSGHDYRQPAPSGSNSDNPKWSGNAVSIGISEYIEPIENKRISIYFPTEAYVGSLACLASSDARKYAAYPVYFRGDESAHNATVPAGSVLRLTFREDAFYTDFYDLADFGVEHEPIVRVGKLPHQLTAENYNGALVGVRADNGKLDKVLTIETSGTTVTETLTSLHSSSPIYVSFMHECFSAHPRVPFGLVTNMEYIYSAGGTPSYGNMPFIFIENGSIVSSSSDIESHIITHSNGKRYFHINNAPVYLSYRSFGPNNVYISIGGPYSGYVGKDGTTLIGFLPSDESEAGLLRLVNCFTPDNYAAEAGSASTADFASKAYTLQAGNSTSSQTCLCGGSIISSYASIQPGGGTTNQNNTLDLGNTTNRWRNIYVNGKTTNYYFEIGNDTTNVVAQPVVRPNTNGYGYIGTSSYHLNAAYINNLYLTSDGTSIATYIGNQIADKVSGTGVGSICLLNVSITNSASSVATISRGSLLNSNSNLSVSTLSIASPHLVTAAYATPSSYNNTVGCYYSGTASGTSGAYKLLSAVYVPASTTKRYIVLAIRVS